MRSLVLIRHNLALLAHEPGPVLSRIGMPLVLITVLQPLSLPPPSATVARPRRSPAC